MKQTMPLEQLNGNISRQTGNQQKESVQNMGTNKRAKLTEMWQNSKYFRNQDLRQNYIKSTPEMAEAFNKFFTTIGPNLACEIPPTNVEPETYLQPTDKVFSLKASNVLTVCKLLSDINERKATGLDKIPCKLSVKTGR